MAEAGWRVMVQQSATVRLLKRLLPVLVVAALLIALFASGLHRQISFGTLQAHHAELSAFVEVNLVLAVVVYVLAYAFLTGISFPAASLVTLLGGFLFGWFLGTVLTVVGATAGATAVFLVARTSIGEALWERVKPFAGRMEEGFRDGEFNYLLFLRLLPVFPFWVVNLLPAFLGVKTGMYMLTTFVGIIPGTAVYNVIGDGLGEVFETGAEFSLENAVSTEIVVGLAGLAVISLVPVVVRKIRARRQDSG